MKYFTTQQVAEHNKIDNCYIIIYNEVYDIGEFIKHHHPGGFIPLSVAGLDATNLFISTHPSYVNQLIKPNSDFYKKYHIGTLYKNTRNIDDDKLYFTLKTKVEQYIKTNKLKARDIPLFDFEIIMFVILTIWTYIKLLMTTQYNYCYSILHGIVYTFMITRTIHDCNHGGLTRDKTWKRYLFTFINEITTTNQSWQEKHNLHHMHTNDICKDPDVDQLFRVSHKLPIKKYHILQTIYSFILYSLFILAQMVGIKYISKNDPEPVHRLYRYFAKFILLIYVASSILYNKFYYWVISMLISGFYLGIVFTVNHNLYFLTDHYRNTDSFLLQQLTSTADYNPGCKLTNYLTHGLNHQTIHHLFPSINYYNYPRLTRDVLIPFCKVNNLKYNGEGHSFLKLLYIHIISLYNWSK